MVLQKVDYEIGAMLEAEQHVGLFEGGGFVEEQREEFLVELGGDGLVGEDPDLLKNFVGKLHSRNYKRLGYSS